MAVIVNLRQRRKQKARDELDRQAAENRAHFGQRKVERLARAAEEERAARELDGHKVPDE